MTAAFAAVVVLLIATLGAYWPTVQSLQRFWNDYSNLTYTHGYLIAAICAWLVWRARHRVSAAAAGFSVTGLVALAIVSVAWGFAYASAIEVGHQLLLPALMLAAVAAFAGWRAAAVLALPIGYLYFAITIWDVLTPYLQRLTVFAVGIILQVFGIPAWLQGSYVHLSNGSFEIAGGCAGLHFFIVANAIAVLYGEIGRDPLKTRIKIVAIASVMAVVMNWIRVSTVIISGYLTDMQSYLVRVSHYYFGWALFGVLLIVYFWAVPRILKLDGRRDAEMPAAVAGAGQGGRSTGASIAVLFVVAVTLAIVPFLTTRAMTRAQGLPVASLVPPKIVGWDGPLAPDATWSPVFAHADQQVRAAYDKGGHKIEVFAASYGYQEQGKELVGYGNDVLGENGLDSRDTGSIPADVATGRPASALITATDGAGAHWSVAYFYDVGGRTFERSLPSKVYYPVALALGQPESRIVAVATRCDGADCKAAARSLSEFLDVAANSLRIKG